MKRPLTTTILIMLVALSSSGTAWSRDTSALLRQYRDDYAESLIPLLVEAIQFPTVEGDNEAMASQKAWLLTRAEELGFVGRDAGHVVEIELPGPAEAPVLGLVVHGDVVAVDEGAWSFPPFEANVRDGTILGRGVADDKGPMIQALLAMKVLAESGLERTHTIRLIVGTNEESKATDITAYLETHQPPALSLVLDSEFPVVVGEKGWNMLSLSTSSAVRDSSKPWTVASVNSGIATSIVPDRADLVLQWKEGEPGWGELRSVLSSRPLPEGTSLALQEDGDEMTISVRGKSAHAGVNLLGGRNALVALGRLTAGLLPASGAADLLSFGALAGKDIYGSGLDIHDEDTIWGRYAVNVATLADDGNGKLEMTINIRRIPPRSAEELQTHLYSLVESFNQQNGAEITAGGYWDDPPLGFDPDSKLVRRLLDVYERSTGTRVKPAISGGGTYAKRLPNAIAFGMWFPGSPYPGHDVDEQVEIESLHRGVRILIEALVDIATNPPIDRPFEK